MKIRSFLLVVTLIGLAFGFNQPAQAATTHKGHVTIPWAPGWLGAAAAVGIGSTDTVTGRAFFAACYADRALVAAGQKPSFVDAMIASPFNGVDGMVFDMKKEKMGAFAVKGPGATVVIPETPALSPVTSYDLDIDFFTDPTVDPTAATTNGCQDANEKALGNSAHKCYAHKPNPDEKTGCISGYKDAKGKVHGARYVLVSAGLNLVGPFDFTLTAP